MDRKRLAVLVLLAVLVVIGYAVGALGRPADDGGGTRDWRDRLSGRSSSDPLRPADLRRTQGSCQWEGAVLRVPTSCALTVDPLDSQVTARPVRAGTIRSSAPVRVALVIEGKQVQMDLDPGKDLRLTAGPSGSDLVVVCRAIAPTQCLLTLAGG